MPQPQTHEQSALARARRLALGTAQFGHAYGIANESGQVRADAAAAILELATRHGIDTLDTAIAYGASETCLGNIGVSDWRVITKLPAIPQPPGDVGAWVEAQVRGSLKRLRIARLEGLLLHHPADLRGPHGESLLRALARLKSMNLIAAAGVSIYDPAELGDLWPVWQPQIVQAPGSVLDQRLLRSGWLSRLHAAGTRVHLRSAFLQGLLLMAPARRPAYFRRWQTLLDAWSTWCAAHGVSALAAALAYVCRLSGVERVVVGVDSVGQLQEILHAACADAPSPPAELFSEDLELLEPSRWRLT